MWKTLQQRIELKPPILIPSEVSTSLAFLLHLPSRVLQNQEMDHIVSSVFSSADRGVAEAIVVVVLEVDRTPKPRVAFHHVGPTLILDRTNLYLR